MYPHASNHSLNPSFRLFTDLFNHSSCTKFFNYRVAHLIHSPTLSMSHLPIEELARLLTHSFTCLLIHWPNQSFTHSLIHSLTHSLLPAQTSPTTGPGSKGTTLFPTNYTSPSPSTAPPTTLCPPRPLLSTSTTSQWVPSLRFRLLRLLCSSVIMFSFFLFFALILLLFFFPLRSLRYAFSFIFM